MYIGRNNPSPRLYGKNILSEAVDIYLHDQDKISNYFADLRLKFNN